MNRRCPWSSALFLKRCLGGWLGRATGFYKMDVGERVLIVHAYIFACSEITKVARSWLGDKLDADKRDGPGCLAKSVLDLSGRDRHRDTRISAALGRHFADIVASEHPLQSLHRRRAEQVRGAVHHIWHIEVASDHSIVGSSPGAGVCGN